MNDQELYAALHGLKPESLNALRQICLGRSVKETANILHFAQSTIYLHLTPAYAALGLQNMTTYQRQRELGAMKVQLLGVLERIEQEKSPQRVLPQPPAPSADESLPPAVQATIDALTNVMKDDLYRRLLRIRETGTWLATVSDEEIGSIIDGEIIDGELILEESHEARSRESLRPYRLAAPETSPASNYGRYRLMALTLGVCIVGFLLWLNFSSEKPAPTSATHTELPVAALGNEERASTSSPPAPATRVSGSGSAPGEISFAQATETPVDAPTPAPPPAACGESQRATANPTFEPLQGVSRFLPENTDHALPSRRARSVTMSQQGLWAGFFNDGADQGGVSHTDKKTWALCGLPAGNINDIAADLQGRVWVAFESEGVAMFDGDSWRRYTPATDRGLPSALTFGLTIDREGGVWVATHEGISRYDGVAWETIYNGANKTVYFNSTHTIAFDKAGNIWVGHISEGVSVYRKDTQKWELIQAGAGTLGGNKIRAIYVQPRPDTSEAVWFATADGGVSVYADSVWQTYGVAAGLPSSSVQDVTEDPLGRIWVATEGGVSYLQDGRWVRYHSLSARSVAFGCPGCPYDPDHVVTATWDHGLTHSRLPYAQAGATVTEICFEVVARDRDCEPFPEVEWVNDQPTVTITYPATLAPGQRFQMEMFLAPTTPYTFSVQRGDKLVSLDEVKPGSDPATTTYGTYIQIAPLRNVVSAEPYRFADDNSPFVAPELPPGKTEHIFTSRWRMWMHTRYSGPVINLRFKVASP